jgi:hypothetical protein
MPFDDLDLEFEDEEESKKKKKEAVDIDIDLEFHTPDGVKPRPHPPNVPPVSGSQPSSPVVPTASPRPEAEVRKIADARAAQVQSKRPPESIPGPRVQGTSAVKEEHSFDLESQQIIELREQVKKVEFEAQVKVSIAEYKVEYLSEMLSDIKLVEHQIGQLLVRINAKHPDMKAEVLMIKKILADFSAKKRK